MGDPTSPRAGGSHTSSPCGAYFDDRLVRDLGLFSESEWKRKGYPKLLPGDTRYLDIDVAKRVVWRRWTHRVDGPRPKARVWRPFYDFYRQRFEPGMWSVGLYSFDQIDQSKYLITVPQALSLLEFKPQDYCPLLPRPPMDPDEILVQLVRGARRGHRMFGNPVQAIQDLADGWEPYMHVTRVPVNLVGRVIDTDGDWSS